MSETILETLLPEPPEAEKVLPRLRLNGSESEGNDLC